MNDVQVEQDGIPQVRSLNRSTARPGQATGGAGFAAVAIGAFALGASAIGALAIGRLAVGALALKRGRVRTLVLDDLLVRRLHVGQLTVDSGVPR